MIIINSRIKQVRLHPKVNLSQEAFGKSLGVTGAAISRVESGSRKASEQIILAICREFSINEEWLRTGAGEMFSKKEESAVDRLCAELHADELEAEIIRTYFKIDEKIRLPFLRWIIQEVQKNPAESEVVVSKNATTTPVLDTAGQEWTDPDIVAELAELKRQNQALAAKVAAMEEEDALQDLTDVFSASPLESAGNLSQKVKK